MAKTDQVHNEADCEVCTTKVVPWPVLLQDITCIYSAMVASMHTYSSLASQRHENVQFHKHSKQTHQQNPWWTYDCALPKDRMWLSFHIWKSPDRPLQGKAYECNINEPENSIGGPAVMLKKIQITRNQYTILGTTCIHAADHHPRHFWNIFWIACSKQNDWTIISIRQVLGHVLHKQVCMSRAHQQEFIMLSEDFINTTSLTPPCTQCNCQQEEWPCYILQATYRLFSISQATARRDWRLHKENWSRSSPRCGLFLMPLTLPQCMRLGRSCPKLLCTCWALPTLTLQMPRPSDATWYANLTSSPL